MPVGLQVRKNRKDSSFLISCSRKACTFLSLKTYKICLQVKCLKSSDAQWRHPALLLLDKNVRNRSLLPPFGQPGYCSWPVALSMKRKQFTDEQILPSLHPALAKQHLISLITQFVHFLCFSTLPHHGLLHRNVKNDKLQSEKFQFH